MTDSTPLISEQSHKKRGHRVLCCCDSRKATILVSLVALVVYILALVGVAWPGDGVPVNGWVIAVYAISILFYFLVIWGAIRFHRCACVLCLIWEIVAIALSITGMAFFDWSTITSSEKEGVIAFFSIMLAWRVLVVYSLGTFVSEVGSGIMSAETRRREQYSCCCNV